MLTTPKGQPYDQQFVMILDSELQRLATLYLEAASPSVRASLFQRCQRVDQALNRYINQHQGTT